MSPPPRALTTAVALLALVVVGGGPGAQAARILGLFPFPSISHQLPFQAVMKALAARGHQVTVISTDPLKEPVANYTDVDLSFSYQHMRRGVKFTSMAGRSWFEMFYTVRPFLTKIIDLQISSPQLQDFLRHNASNGYDLVFLEWIGFQSYFGVVHAVGSPPLVGIMPVGGFAPSYAAIGNPNNPAFNPEPIGGLSDQMTFWERVYNTYMHVRLSLYWKRTVLPQQEALLRKHFGSGPPPVAETERNLTLLVLNNHFSTDYPRALLPGVVQLAGLHVQERPPPLSAQLQQWLDGAGPAGAVYFSLGSNVMSKDLPEETRGALLRALGRLPQRVLWKWEADELPGCPDNVRVAKWMPQQSVLAHPNVRLFVTQGGLQSFQEAAYHAVPLLAIPFMGDQPYNSAKMVSAGIGERLELSNITEEVLYETITRLIEDPGYRTRMRRFSAVFREHKAQSLEQALWWVEYVLRHEGAPHLRPASLRLAWYQQLLLDVAAAVVAAALAAALVALWAGRALLRALRSAFSPAPSPAIRRRKDQ